MANKHYRVWKMDYVILYINDFIPT